MKTQKSQKTRPIMSFSSKNHFNFESFIFRANYSTFVSLAIGTFDPRRVLANCSRMVYSHRSIFVMRRASGNDFSPVSFELFISFHAREWRPRPETEWYSYHKHAQRTLQNESIGSACSPSAVRFNWDLFFFRIKFENCALNSQHRCLLLSKINRQKTK